MDPKTVTVAGMSVTGVTESGGLYYNISLGSHISAYVPSYEVEEQTLNMGVGEGNVKMSCPYYAMHIEPKP